MSFNRKKYDAKCHNELNNDNSSINNYLLNAPENDCNNCYNSNPEIRFQKKSIRENTDIENDLFGIERKNSCDTDFHSCDSGMCKTQEFDTVPQDEIQNDCSIQTYSSRFDSVKNLKESTVNRWEWLPIDPQKHAISDLTPLSSRNHIKDNHKPDFDTPSDTSNVLEVKKKENKYTVPVKTTPF